MSNNTKRDHINVLDDIALGPEQQAAFHAFEDTRENYFLTGKAGTGKSVLLQYFVKHTKKKVVIVAPTGIAAINVGGQTIHSFFSLSIGVQKPEDPEARYFFSDEKEKMYRELDVLVIDEVSMVRADVMEMISAKLSAAREEYFEPFGGCQIIAVGDLYQLPPVGEKDLDAQTYLEDRYASLFFFNAPSVKNFPFHILELQHIYRQTDSNFINILNRIRTGENSEQFLSVINSRYHPAVLNQKLVTLTSTNDRAEAINEQRLQELDGPLYVYEAIIDGHFEPRDCIEEQTLRLKVGARIMMLRNDSEKRWANGSIGVIAALSECSIVVAIGDGEYLVDREVWESKRYCYKRDQQFLQQETVGTFAQYPLKLAYAVTIHKSQGQTYDGAIIDLNYGAFAPGQTYVALSRCRSLDHLYLMSPLRPGDIKAEQSVVDYMNVAKRSFLSTSSDDPFDFGNANEQQKEAITTTNGPVLITAGPGTGKTFTLVKRVLYLIEQCGVKPEEILLATFTEKAAKELVTRITNELSEHDIAADISSMMVGTFHSICLRIIKEHAEYARVRSGFRVIDDFDQQYIIYNNLHVFQELEGYKEFMDTDTRWKQSAMICQLANTIAEELVDPQAMLTDSSAEVRFAASVYMAYQNILDNEKYMDYSSLQTDAYLMLKGNKTVLNDLQNRIHYLMIDEYQDTNYIQEQIIMLLGGEKRNICVVGDDDQGLYRFRGATVRNILEFPERFTKGECRIIHLVNNYRSTKEIVDFYNAWMASDQV